MLQPAVAEYLQMN